jgi:uroporphyrinogen-III decarboxylase
MKPRELVLHALTGNVGPVPWIEIETRDELIAKAVGVDTPTWDDRVRYASTVGIDNVGFAHWERFGCDVISKGGVLGFNPRIASRADLHELKVPDPEKIDFASLREKVLRAREAIGDTGLALFVAHIFCLDPIIMDMGLANFSVALYEDRSLLLEMMDRYVDYYSALDEFYSSLEEIDFIWVGEDIAYNTGTIISPEMLRELVFPRFKTIASHIQKPWVYHSDGDIGEVIPDLLELGMNAIHPLEPAAMDIGKVKDRYGERVALVGNVDINTLVNGSEEDVRKETLAVIERCSPGGGYLLSSGNSLTNYVLPENVAAMGRAKREWNSTRNQ